MLCKRSLHIRALRFYTQIVENCHVVVGGGAVAWGGCGVEWGRGAGGAGMAARIDVNFQSLSGSFLFFFF